jgi:cytochrome c-type biogenesis protein CcmE
MKTKHWISIGVIVGALAYLIFGGLGQNLVYFITPSEYFQEEAKYQNRSIRLGGLVKDSIRYNPQTLELKFVVTDGVREVAVEHSGTPPALFKANQGVVVEGKFEGSAFKGTNLLVKHSESYQAPKDGQNLTPEQIKKLIEEAN